MQKLPYKWTYPSCCCLALTKCLSWDGSSSIWIFGWSLLLRVPLAYFLNASHSQILTEYRSQFSLHNSINVLWFTPCSYSGLLVLSSVKRTSDPSRRIAWTVDKRWLHAPAFKEWRQTILISHLHTWLSISPNLGDQSGGHPALARVTGSYALFVFRLFPEYLSFSWHSDFLFYNN